MSLDYDLWTESDGERTRWMWEVVRISEAGGDDEKLEGGIADSREQAMREIAAALSRH
jgi:hypothetical protein